MKSTIKQQDFGLQKVRIPIKDPFLGRKRSFASDANSLDSAQADGEGTWIFSYADLITILMMFFIMMLSISKVSPEKFNAFREALKTTDEQVPKSAPRVQTNSIEKTLAKDSEALLTEVSHAVASTVGDQNAKILAGAKVLLQSIDSKKLVVSADQTKDFEKLQRELKNLKGLTVTAVPRSKAKDSKIIISIPSHTLFGENGKDILPDKISIIRQMYARIKKIEPQPKIEIAAHLYSDNRLEVGLQNLEITAQQSAIVLAFFVKYGFNDEQISASGYGNMRPLIGFRDRFGQVIAGASQVNSRIEIALVSRDKGAD